MATAYKREDFSPSIHEAYLALSIMQDRVMRILPEVESATIRLEPSGVLRIHMVVNGIPTVAVKNQQKIVFWIENRMITGYHFGNPVCGFDSMGKRTITAVIDTKEG